MAYESQIAQMRAQGWSDKGIEEWLKDPASSSLEDSIGPAWDDPYGCCFGECDTPFSVAFREYHGLEEAWQQYKRECEVARKRRWKSLDRRPPIRGIGGNTLDDMLSWWVVKNTHDLPRYLRKRLLRLRRRAKKENSIDNI